ncbi:hypothetical protein PsYK624_153180 [Phanerochaete sordida]|uniref:Uncharacterized protein n=1 Tax=Phanerochaete sordida TaxID=48140 RepID=A0A9P3GP21_9APHY|nr:hypothetical protein PsYK624_153180 [Phanerochaete sordida]
MRVLLSLLVACYDVKTVVNVPTDGAVSFMSLYSAYSIVKLAVFRLAEWLGHEHGDHGALTHAAHSGLVRTDMAASLMPKLDLDDMLALPAYKLPWLMRERREWLAGRDVYCHWDLDALIARRQEIVDGNKFKVGLVA